MGKVASRTGRRMAVLGVLLGLVLAAAAAQAQAVAIRELQLPLVGTRSPNHITAGAEGNLWISGHNEASIDRVTPEGDLTEFFVTPNSSPEGITVGPNGKLWFTEEAFNRIGRLTPAGGLTEFASGGITGQTAGVVLGPEGNLWFTQHDGVVGRITTAGSVTEFSGGISQSARGIALGPDGNLWFTEESKIGRITPHGVVTEFSEGMSPDSDTWGIALGPDGNLWFTDRGTDRIGRITPDGVVSEFSEGITPDSEPLEIAAGPDGNLWFTERAGARIGRITPNGVVTEFSEGISPGSGPSGITAGPDDSMWFTELAGRIGQVILSATARPTVVTEAASSVIQNSARLNATVNPNGGAVSDCHFEYGTSEAYGSSVPCASLPGSGESPVAVSASIGSLSANTTYHVRVVATNPGGTSYGNDHELTETPACNDCNASVGKAPLGPKEPAGGWSVEYADTFTKPLGTGKGEDNTWIPGYCETAKESLERSCGGSEPNELEDFNHTQVSTSSEGLALTCKYESTAVEPGNKHYLCGIVSNLYEPEPGYKDFRFSGGHGADLVFQVVMKLPPNSDDADPAFWSSGKENGDEHEFDFPEVDGWGNEEGGKLNKELNGWKFGELLWNYRPQVYAPLYDAFSEDPTLAYHTYTTELFPNNKYSVWIDGVERTKEAGANTPSGKEQNHLILQYALRSCTEKENCPATSFTSGTRTFHVKSVAVYEDKSHAGVGLEDTGLAPGTSVE